jgi:hypothetical protein
MSNVLKTEPLPQRKHAESLLKNLLTDDDSANNRYLLWEV